MMLELDPDSVLERKLRELCEDNPSIAKALTGKEQAEDFQKFSDVI